MRKLVRQYIGHPGIAQIEARDVESPYGLGLALRPSSFHFREWSDTHKILQSMAEREVATLREKLQRAEQHLAEVKALQPPPGEVGAG